jgi:hypothetical protein
LYTGEIYYRLGIMQEAQHCAFEASLTDYGAKAMRRLVFTAMLRHDTAAFEKYVRLFEVSPVYHRWAKAQRENFRHFRADSAYVIPGAPQALTSGNFVMNYVHPESNLHHLLQSNPQHKKVFETLVAYYLLHKNLNAVFELMEQYYPAMAYTYIPRHIEEALLLSVIDSDKRDYILDKYRIRKKTADRFMAFLTDSKSSMTKTELQAKYGDTYCYYYLTAEPLMLNEVYNSVY